MSDDLPTGATPIDPDEAEGLIPEHVVTRGELDELEEANVQEALEWALGRSREVLSEEFVYELHRRMFDSVWAWAGKVRLTDKNIGVDKHIVRTEVRKLIGDALYWRENLVYEPDELAVRFHHRLVSIHPFPNGNGRHARLMADLLVRQLGGRAFSWGGVSLTNTSELRTAYIGALHAADKGDVGPLLDFARS
ncbi:MAG: mobile mystery protein B [Gemmatimonadetes bacterium]|nr:mobile mystery protein B [Gemmatimonadota bacterium]